MRVLFTTTPVVGHFHPLVPIARALESARHVVAFASTPNFASTVEASGFSFFPIGPGLQEILATPEMQEYARLTDSIARRELMRRQVYPGLVPRLWLSDLMAQCEGWAPDVIVTENCEFAGRVAAERRDIPHAALKVGDVYGYAERHELVPAMDEHRRSVGLPPDPDGSMLFRYLFLLNEPLSLQNTGELLPPTTFRCRRVVFDESGHEQRPDWLTDGISGPIVFATAGTVVNSTPGLLESFLAALRDEPFTVILTTGRDRDPAQFGPQPDHVHIERYIPESLVLHSCDLVLSHCGSGTMYAALDNGLPMVNVPIGMDQFENAADCERLRVGVTVDPTMRSVEAIRAAVRQVLADPSYRINAQRMQQEMQALPGPSEVVTVLERLARDKHPFNGSLTEGALA